MKGPVMRFFVPVLIILMVGLVWTGCGRKTVSKRAPAEYVKGELDKLAPVKLECDLSTLSESDKKVAALLIEASEIIDDLFLIQVNRENPELLEALKASDHPDNQAYVDLFTIMFGPWNRLEEDKPFVTGEEKPAGAGFYPEDMTKKEFQNAVKEYPELEELYTGTFTAITRVEGDLTPVYYNEFYRDKVQEVSDKLREAAEACEDPTLETYLKLRAEAFLTDDYFESDMAWMDLAGDLEVVIGPYEVYEDKLFNYKAAYEAFICMVDHEESQKLATVSGYLREMEDHLPIPDKHKNFDRGSSSPIKVVQEIFSAGDTKAGIQTTAFNLPNDERVREAKGSKKVMLKNVARAKFDKCWIPIVNTILDEKPLAKVSFDAYFNHVLMHEMSHGLGPGNIILEDGTPTTVARELKELYSVVEECKADVLGVWNMQYMIDKGVFPHSMQYSTYASYLGGMFRSIRFGIDEAHGGGVAIQFNYLMEAGAFKLTEKDKLTVVPDKLMPAIEKLAHTLLMIQAKGDYEAAKEFVDTYRKETDVIERMIEKLKHVPIDIHPSYPAAEELVDSAL